MNFPYQMPCLNLSNQSNETITLMNNHMAVIFKQHTLPCRLSMDRLSSAKWPRLRLRRIPLPGTDVSVNKNDGDTLF